MSTTTSQPSSPAGRTDRLKGVLPRLTILLVVAGVLIGGWYWDNLRARQQSVLSGVFESEPSELSTRVEGRVAQILVQEGDTVNAGQPLVELDATPNELASQADLARAAQARQALAQAVNGPTVNQMAKARADVLEASAQLAELVNGPLPEQIRQQRANLAAAQANYRKVMAGPRPEDIDQARQAADSALAKLTQAQNGPTAQEIGQAKARLDDATAAEKEAKTEAARDDALYAADAITRQDRDRADAAAEEATANRQQAEQAYDQELVGTRPEEIAADRHAYLEAKANLAEMVAGSRQEDKDAAAAQVAAQQQALDLLLRGSRSEDIAAARARLAGAQATLADLLAGTRREEIAQQRAAARAAALNALSSAATVSDRTVRATRAGVVERVLIAVGDLITPGEAVIRLDDPTDIWLRVYVPERHLAQFEVGNDATLRIDGINGQVPAVVESIATQGEFTPANLQAPEERENQVFAVRLRLKTPDRRVRPGISATVTQIGQYRP